MAAHDIPADLDETARIILLDFAETAAALPYTQRPGPKALHDRLVEEGCDLTGRVGLVATLWSRYMGFDGAHPTHDLDTGRRL